MSRYVVEPLAGHDRATFSSGSESLDRHFYQQVTQDVRRRIASCFVAVSDDGELAGFYTLAATSLAFDRLSAERASRLPRYPVVPGILLGRLAVAKAHQGRRLGGALVADALLRSARTEIVGHILVVDAIDDAAARFYQHLGFEPLADDRHRLIRPI
ncbi:GNAT family N-acetyltransferase [Phenylobacterium sp.]|uniref:GNAT family N-acetyltransferase n=1 Tax=Phenylobacterium sp. TaxID=1871053 RepID=UPI002723AD16|nr:GNAT family N-acetyltransferase [Phenylobacterium sp.]MDO8379283.1 GNAT family N-acetyltransferase [Phenylobacterium sp.]